MSIFSFLKDKVDKVLERLSTTNSKLNRKMNNAFKYECPLCDNPIDYYHVVLIEDTKVPVCLLCRAKIENGIRWDSILKGNYVKEKRRYYEKYLRLIIWISEDN